jgi:hypothetical protein
MEEIMKTLLKKKIEDAIAERQEPKGYGDNPEELQTTTSGYIYVTTDELNQIVKSRRCKDISLSTNLGGYDEEGLKNDKYYPYAFSVHVDLTKKSAKRLISDFESRCINDNKLIKVLVSRCLFIEGKSEGKFRICL